VSALSIQLLKHIRTKVSLLSRQRKKASRRESSPVEDGSAAGSEASKLQPKYRPLVGFLTFFAWLL